MRRSAIRFFAVFILTLLGAPLAMHVVMHDLDRDHHEDDGSFHHAASEHTAHEHPVISSPAPTAPDSDTPTMLVSLPVMGPQRSLRGHGSERSVMALGALHLFYDTGPQSLLSTFLI